MLTEDVINIAKENFKKEVLESDQLVMIDFWASWCGPCRAIAPIVDELAVEYKGKAKICKINVDEESELAQEFKVMSIPTIVFFKNGETVDKIVGARAKKDLADKIEELI